MASDISTNENLKYQELNRFENTWQSRKSNI